MMQEYWKAGPVLQEILEIPDYYAENTAFCFGKLFSDYVSGEKTEELARKFPKVCEEPGEDFTSERWKLTGM